MHAFCYRSWHESWLLYLYPDTNLASAALGIMKIGGSRMILNEENSESHQSYTIQEVHVAHSLRSSVSFPCGFDPFTDACH